MSQTERTIEGRLVGVTGKAEVSGVEVWFAYRTVDGQEATANARSDEEGRFTFPLPDESLQGARVGAILEGLAPVDLEPAGQPLEPGDVTLIIDDIVPSHLRYGF